VAGEGWAPTRGIELKIGDTAIRIFIVSDEVVRTFSGVTGDQNPVHLDEEFAKSTRFGRRIAHGMIAASQISAAIGNTLPGPGSVYLSQSLRFVAPVFIGDTLRTKLRITSIREGKPIATIETICENQRGDVVLTGEATVLFEGPQG
jgi:3-hydroxybutyryl-CoA dehydratase